VTDLLGNPVMTHDVRRAFCIEIEYEVLKPLPYVRVGLLLTTADGTVVFSSADTLNHEWRVKTRGNGLYVSRCEIPANLLNEGVYVATIGADTPSVERYFYEENVINFHIEQTNGPGGSHDPDKWAGVICPVLKWDVEFCARMFA
jgi:lipopolysaccharide transport system ATP-binding protein